MASSPLSQNCTFDQCIRNFGENYNDPTQEQLDASVPWIGMYIAAASAACAVAMAADAANALRTKKLWVPCKYFSLNAFSLTVLAVAMKLPVDLTARMKGTNDKLARLSSLVLMSIAMSNFIASLGNNEVMLNLAALGILVITVAANASVHIFQVRSHYYANLTLVEKVVAIACMLILLVVLCSTAVMVSTAKRYIESQYSQMHQKIFSNYNEQGRKFTTNELRVAVRRYWMMSESGAPQFVIARSATCVAPGMMCLLMSLTLLQAYIRLTRVYPNLKRTASHYKWSTDWILVIQTIGVGLGTIAPLLRWFTLAHFKSTKIGWNIRFGDEIKVEAYWTQSLRNWRDSPLPLKTGHHKFRKILHEGKRFLLNFCIGVQVLIVRANKLVLLVSAVFVKGLMFCFSKESSENSIDCESRAGVADINMDFSPYVLRLEGEAELPKRMLENICNEVDELIRLGKTRQSKNLITLLRKSVNFNGVREFDSLNNSQLEPPNCWSLPAVTLTSIAISLPNIEDRKCKQLFTAVSEGLYFARLVEKTTNSNGELRSIRNAADVVWIGVELYRKWQDKDLQVKGRTHKETMQKLSDVAEKTVKNFTTNTNNFLVQDPLNWPVKVIAANSMYRITRNILSAHEDDHDQTDGEMFERLSIMISDILAACLSNLTRVISLKCHNNAIKEREKNIRESALLLGESEEILEILQQRALPTLDPEKAVSIEAWRACIN